MAFYTQHLSFFFILYTVILCVNAYRVPVVDSVSSASSEELPITPPDGQPQQPQPISPVTDSISSASSSEEALLLAPGGPRESLLSGVGVVSQPVLQAVKVKVPKYGNILDTNLIL